MHEKLDLSIVVAMTPRRVIGKNDDLPWGRIRSDLKRFQAITCQNNVVVLGRKTFDSIVTRLGHPLPRRQHVVLSRETRPSTDGTVAFVTSVDEALEAVARYGIKGSVIGGAEVYRLFLPLVTRLYVTTVYSESEGDTFFPELGAEWVRADSANPLLKRRFWHEDDAHETSFDTLVRS